MPTNKEEEEEERRADNIPTVEVEDVATLGTLEGFTLARLTAFRGPTIRIALTNLVDITQITVIGVIVMEQTNSGTIFKEGVFSESTLRMKGIIGC
ncbi:hypothetical protein V6N12_023357 [Hibiscus sabdariffa]|uniref:Uncharacterized protein n=1 Tax=Hibiscus sabdariffa TaxID=183260 RepID=A0ABR2FXL5_9ROSI